MYYYRVIQFLVQFMLEIFKLIESQDFYLARLQPQQVNYTNVSYVLSCNSNRRIINAGLYNVSNILHLNNHTVVDAKIDSCKHSHIQVTIVSYIIKQTLNNHAVQRLKRFLQFQQQFCDLLLTIDGNKDKFIKLCFIKLLESAETINHFAKINSVVYVKLVVYKSKLIHLSLV